MRKLTATVLGLLATLVLEANVALAQGHDSTEGVQDVSGFNYFKRYEIAGDAFEVRLLRESAPAPNGPTVATIDDNDARRTCAAGELSMAQVFEA